MERTIAKHPNAIVKFYTDSQCEHLITNVHSRNLATNFRKEHHGPYKSDICRLAMLYKWGGMYLDNDLEVVGDIRDHIPDDASFASVIELDSKTNVFQAFVAARPSHLLIQRALNATATMYARHGRWQGNSWMGPKIMGSALRSWVGSDRLNVGWNMAAAAGRTDGVYLFQESRDVRRFALKPRQGRGCCCNVFIADSKEAIAWSRFVGASQFCDV